ncbi:MAG: hypothetical protein AAGC47_01635 [Bacteroidota bacterium]
MAHGYYFQFPVKVIASFKRTQRILALWACCIIISTNVNAQVRSENGWILPTKGTVRVYVVFVEIDYDIAKSQDKYPDGTKGWRRGELPSYKDEMFNTFSGEDSLKYMSKYYQECSFGNLEVLGDYYPELITLKHSSIRKNKTKLFKEVAKIINAADTISSKNLSFEDFDFWQKQTKRGYPKEKSSEFNGIDHIMFFTRNFAKIPSQNGQANGSSAAIFGGKGTDSYSIFGGGGKIPFSIMKHEFNHLLIGGNNFHSGGGNSAPFMSYLVSVQGGWSMMGAANSSLLSACGWDRMWLGWKPEDKKYQISCLDESGKEKVSDLNAEGEDQTFVIRDFISSGDAIRIKLPFIPEGEYQQWIWVENHTTEHYNGSPTDRYKFEHYDCMEKAAPGLYLVRQIDANTTEGKQIYRSVKADYLKPMPANGAFDYSWEKEKIDIGSCVDSREHYVYEQKSDFENPLAGNHDLEFPYHYDDSTKFLTGVNMRGFLYRRNPDKSITRLTLSGTTDHPMMNQGVRKIGLVTNPSTASTLTYVNNRKRASTDPKNSGSVYLNGISIEILEVLEDLALKVKVCFNDTLLNEPRRWAGGDIILNNHNDTGADLYINERLILDRGKTATRIDSPEKYGGERYFSSSTSLQVEPSAEVVLNNEMRVLKDSKLIIKEEGGLRLNRRSQIILEDDSELILEEGAYFSGKGRIKIRGSALCLVYDEKSRKKLRRRTWQKRKVRLEPPVAIP